MKIFKQIMCSLLVLGTSIGWALAQDANDAPAPQSRLVQEMGTAGNNCEEGFALMDGFFAELSNDPSAHGVIYVHGDVDSPRASRSRERQLLNHIMMRRFDRDRVTISRGPLMKNGKTMFWLVPAGADDPPLLPGVPEPADSARAPATAPYLFAAEYADGIPGCGSNLYDLGEFAKVLKAEPGSLGRIVMGRSSRRLFRESVGEALAELAANGVPRTRIRTFYKYVRPHRLLEFAGLWVIPKRPTTRTSGVAPPRSRSHIFSP